MANLKSASPERAFSSLGETGVTVYKVQKEISGEE